MNSASTTTSFCPTLHTSLAGTRYQNRNGSSRQAVLAALYAHSESCEVRLVPEPDNPFDENAVGVHAVHGPQGQVGYIPRGIAGRIAGSIQNGHLWSGQASLIRMHDGRFEARLELQEHKLDPVPDQTGKSAPPALLEPAVIGAANRVAASRAGADGGGLVTVVPEMRDGTKESPAIVVDSSIADERLGRLTVLLALLAGVALQSVWVAVGVFFVVGLLLARREVRS